MDIISKSFLSIAAYYISSKLPSDYERRCDDYARSLLPCNNQSAASVSKNQAIQAQASYFVKNPAKSGPLIRIISLASHVGNLFLLTPPPVAIGLSLLKIAEVTLFQIDDSNHLYPKEQNTNNTYIYCTAKVLRLTNRLVSVTALAATAWTPLAKKHFAVFVPCVTFCVFEGILPLLNLYLGTSCPEENYKRFHFWKSDFYITDLLPSRGN